MLNDSELDKLMELLAREILRDREREAEDLDPDPDALLRVIAAMDDND